MASAAADDKTPLCELLTKLDPDEKDGVEKAGDEKDELIEDVPDQLLSGARDELPPQYVPEEQPANAVLDSNVVAAIAATVVKIRDIADLSYKTFVLLLSKTRANSKRFPQ